VITKLKSLPTNRIAEARSSKGLTQQALADKVGSHWITISKLERGKMRLTDEWLYRIGEALDVEIHELLPSERVLTTVSVTGEIFPGGEISYYEADDPHTNTLYNSLFHGDGMLWFYCNTSALLPLFHDGDLLGFREAYGSDPSVFKDRLSLCWIADQKKFIVGFISSGAKKNLYTVALLGGGLVKDALITIVAPLKIVIADLDQYFDDSFGDAPDGAAI
jgi:transcriptional regulator with XRE-family HTH domain